jgi:hypothetical protein
MPSDRFDFGLFLVSHGFASGLPPFARDLFEEEESCSPLFLQEEVEKTADDPGLWPERTPFSNLRDLSFFSACLGEGFAKPGASVSPW